MEPSSDSLQDTGGDPVTEGLSDKPWGGAEVYRVTRPPNDDATQIRAFTDQATDTESVWVDPNLLPSGGPITTGSLLGQRYLLEQVLGEGGIGVVYRATDQEVSGEIFAIKVLRPEIRRHPGALKLLREEVRKTRALRHPNIVGVYSLNSDPGGIYMLMEYLEGKPLSVLIDEEFGRGMPPLRAWPFIHDVGMALAYAHDHSVIHSDLKPSNMFITTSGKAKLLDFGIARAARAKADRFDPGALGALTPAYASPEMLQGSLPDQSDDVYSFACVIYEMLSGRHPFDRVNAIEARNRKMLPAPIASLSRSENKSLARALAFSRAERTRSVEPLLAGIKGMGRHARLSPYLLVGGAALCAVVGGSAWLAMRNPASQPSVAASAPSTALPSSIPALVGTAPVESPAGQSTVAPPLPPLAQASRPESQLPPSSPPSAPEAEMKPYTPPVARTTPVPKLGKKADPAIVSGTEAKPPHDQAPIPERSTDQGDVDHPPLKRNLPAIALTEQSRPLVDNSCPYPPEARNAVETGVVVLLVYVATDGSVLNTKIDQSSGSAVLDSAAANCIRAHGVFDPKIVGNKPVSYWGRTKFNWSLDAG